MNRRIRHALGTNALWVLCAITLTISIVSVAGCSDDYNTGYTMQPPFRDDIKTVAVPIWSRGQGVYRRDLEMALTEAIAKRIEGYTPYKVTVGARADTLLEGTIEEVIQTPLSLNPDTGRPREQTITMLVSFRWTDLRSHAGGATIVERKNFRASATYLPSSPLNQTFFSGKEDLFNRLADLIVQQMELPMGDAQ